MSDVSPAAPPPSAHQPSLKLTELWNRLPPEPRQVVLNALSRLIKAQALPDGREVAHERS